MEKPLISVIVPVYMVEEYLEECIKSILNQTYRNYEVILVDDGSKDNCPDLCDRYEKEFHNIKVIHKDNGGLSSARNSGIEVASGDYFVFIDSDDMVHPDYLSTMVELAMQYEADLVCCSFIHGIQCEWNQSQQQRVDVKEGYDILESIYQDDVLKTVAWNKLYHRSIFLDHEIRYPEGKIYEDMFIAPQILYVAKCMVITDRQLYFYRKRDGSIMSEAFNKRKLHRIDACVTRMMFLKSIKRNKLFYIELENYTRTILTFYFLLREEPIQKYKNEIKLIRKRGIHIIRRYFLNSHLSIKLKLRLLLFLFNIDSNIKKKEDNREEKDE